MSSGSASKRTHTRIIHILICIIEILYVTVVKRVQAVRLTQNKRLA
jgi:hypothetical protein